MPQYYTTSQAIDFIHKHAAIIWRDALDIFPDIGELPAVSCVLEGSGVAGRAYHATATKPERIEYNLLYVCTLPHPRLFLDTIAHEIAHIIQFRCYPEAPIAHGRHFRAIMEAMGYCPDTYHYYNMDKAKAAYHALSTSSVDLSSI
jgi:hypothetical protein